jgi:hypothetical protein
MPNVFMLIVIVLNVVAPRLPASGDATVVDSGDVGNGRRHEFQGGQASLL